MASAPKIDNRSRLSIRFMAAKRLLYTKFLLKANKSILVTSYPKSGSTWLTHLVSEASGIYYPHNEGINLFKQYVLHGHYLYAPNHYKTIALIRDPRDIMVSFYFYIVKDNEVRQNYFRKELPSSFKPEDGIEKNLATVIEYLHTGYLKNGYGRFSFENFANSFVGKSDVCLVRYEDLLTKPKAELARIIAYTDLPPLPDKRLEEVIEKYAMSSMKKRLQKQLGQAQEDKDSSFFRKGVAGDWKNHFTAASATVFNHYLGEALLTTGYESTLDWHDSK